MNSNKKMTVPELIDYVNSTKGKRGGWPNYFDYKVAGDCITISVDNKILDKKATRRLDPWGLAFLTDAKSLCGIKINTINFAISGRIDDIKPDNRLTPNLEAFRRRVSFLSINNKDLRFGITINGGPMELDDNDTLFNRPDNEKIHESSNRIAKDNQPGKLEKDFQTWLCPEHIKDKDLNINEKLAVLGFDFFNLKRRELGIIREFQTGSFLDKITNKNRILPTEFVDIVTLNKHGKLAIIELKLMIHNWK